MRPSTELVFNFDSDTGGEMVQFYGHGPVNGNNVPLRQPVTRVGVKVRDLTGLRGVLLSWVASSKRFQVLMPDRNTKLGKACPTFPTLSDIFEQ